MGELTYKWVFPQKRSDTFSSGRCVYFVVADLMPGLIKIGFTGSLATRINHLGKRYQSDQKPLTVIAFIKSPQHKAIERMLHKQFAEYRRVDEWFEIVPVLTWMRGGVS